MKLLQLGDKQIAVKSVYPSTISREDIVLVFLHEALGSIAQWKLFPEQIGNALQVKGIVYEREGYGQSSPLKEDRSTDYLHKYALEELPDVLDALLPSDKKVVLVGHSDGASIALLYAAKYPQRVAGVVSMAAHVIVEDVTLAGIAPAVTAYQQGKLDGLRKFHGDKTERLFYAWANTWNLPAFRSWNICQDIAAIQCPVLAIQGDLDQYGTELQLDLIQSSVLNGKVEKVMISRCNHHPHLDKPVEVEAKITSLFSTNFPL